jgi:glycosyltransferase involved in cell wall biosynthesis
MKIAVVRNSNREIFLCSFPRRWLGSIVADNRTNEAPVHIFHHAFQRGAGMERCVVSLAESLKQLGRRVVVHTIVADQELCRSLGVELDLLPFKRFPRKLQAFRFFRQVEMVRRRVEGIEIGFSRVRTKDIHVAGGTHRGYLSHARKWAGPFDYLQFWMERQSYPFSRRIVAHSELIAEDLKTYYALPQSSIRVLHPPLDERYLKPAGAPPAREALRKSFGWPQDKVVFLFPSSGHKRKGLHQLCAALAPFSDTILIPVAGRRLRGAFPRFVVSMGRVENMPDAYRAADFTLLGSYYEPFGLVGPESVLCGTRLVFEQKIGCLPVINPELVFKFSVWDIDSIREAVQRAINLAKEGGHHFQSGPSALRYDPDPVAHARAVLDSLERAR